MTKQSSITGEIILLCERLEIAQFMHAYLRYLFKQGLELPHMQIINYQGVGRLQELSQRLAKLAGSRQVRKVLLLADADEQSDERMQEFFAVRDNEFFKTVPECRHFFFPGRRPTKRWQQGYLEDALWQALRHDTAEYNDFYNLHNMSAEYLLVVNNNRGREHRLANYNRHLLYTYFAATEKYVGLRLGEAAQAGAFDLQHPVFDSLKESLMALCAGKRAD